MAGPFLTARWTNICMATYEVEPSLVQSHLPLGVGIDRHEGRTLVSLVAFMFERLRVKGIPIPGVQRFVELNLRFYVERYGQKGVIFIREIAPSRLVCAGARFLYNEPYERAPGRAMIDDDERRISVNYLVRTGTQHHNFRVVGRKPPFTPGDTTIEHFLKERPWGFGRTKRGHLFQYKVEHPLWAIYPVDTHSIDIDWVRIYGARWRIMHEKQPVSVLLARGSDVELYWREVLK